MTGRKQPPLMGDWTHMLLQDDHLPSSTAIMQEFQEELATMVTHTHIHTHAHAHTYLHVHHTAHIGIRTTCLNGTGECG